MPSDLAAFPEPRPGLDTPDPASPWRATHGPGSNQLSLQPPGCTHRGHSAYTTQPPQALPFQPLPAP
eukprot:6929002-Lingulodinium_polyedra.AAC.1